MKKIAGTLKTDQAQYRELEAFSKFGGDMDPVTKRTLDKGRKNSALLVQPQYKPYPVEKQIAIVYAGTKGLLFDLPIDKINSFIEEYQNVLKLKHQDTLDTLRSGVLNEEVERVLTDVANNVVKGIVG